jgi:hypothetical protein
MRPTCSIFRIRDFRVGPARGRRGHERYQTADWALAVDVLPRAHDAGKDMGIWHVALVLPQVVATPVSGILLDRLKPVSLSVACTALFLMAAFRFVLGTALIARVRGVR